MRKRLLILLAGLFASWPLWAADYQEGVHYFPLSTAQPIQTGAQIEVTELFWYGCPHCYNLEPEVQKWLKNKPKNAEYIALPAVMRDSWAVHARAYFTFEALGLVDKLHQSFFDAIHQEKKRYRNAEQVADFASEFGVKREDFIDTYNSFGVDSKVQHARLMSNRYEATGVPAIIVDGKYRATASSAGSHAELMKLVNFLVAKAAKER